MSSRDFWTWSNEVKLKLTIIFKYTKHTIFAVMVNCQVSTKMHAQNQNIILYSLLCRVFGYADFGKCTGKPNASPHLRRQNTVNHLKIPSHDHLNKAIKNTGRKVIKYSTHVKCYKMKSQSIKYQCLTTGSIIRPLHRITKCPLNILCASNVGTTLKQDSLNNHYTKRGTIFEDAKQ
jgi:hypothetical protein